MCLIIDLLVSPTNRFNTEELYILSTLHLLVFNLSQNKQRLLPHIAQTD